MRNEPAMLALIGLVYDAVIDPTRWHGALDAIRAHFGFYNAMLGVHRVPTGEGVLNVTVNVTPEQQKIALDYMTHVPDLWGGVERGYNLPLEEPVLQSHHTDPATWPDNPYFRHFGMPLDLVDVVGLALVRDTNTLATLGFALHRSHPALTEAQFDDLRMLAPHLARAVVISRILDVATVQAESFRAALDATPSGVVLVDAQGGVVHANAPGKAMLAAGDPLRQRGNRIELVSEIGSGQFAAALAAAADELRMGRRGMGIPARRRDGTPLVVRVLPLARRSIRDGAIQSAVAAIFVTSPTADPETLTGALELMFELTPAEARVFILAATGMPNKRIATTVGVAPSTIKTHLKRIFEKTGSRNRADLVRLAQDVGGATG